MFLFLVCSIFFLSFLLKFRNINIFHVIVFIKVFSRPPYFLCPFPHYIYISNNIYIYKSNKKLSYKLYLYYVVCNSRSDQGTWRGVCCGGVIIYSYIIQHFFGCSIVSQGPCTVMKEEPKGLHDDDDRMDGCWCCCHDLLFRGRGSQDKEEDDEKKKKKKKKVIYYGYFYCRIFIGWCIYIYIYILYIYIYLSIYKCFFFWFVQFSFFLFY
jgi:hypothetical protein